MIIVLTGGIGSGKSAAAEILNKVYGYPVYQADSAVKRLYLTDSDLLNDIESDAGRHFRDSRGQFSPALMADYIFTVPGAVEMVEKRVFPVLLKDFEAWKSGNEVVVFESATILEKPFFKGFGDAVIIVDAPLEVRIERAMNRDGATREKIMERVVRQKMMNDISLGIVPKDVYICSNVGSMSQLQDNLSEIIKDIIK